MVLMIQIEIAGMALFKAEFFGGPGTSFQGVLFQCLSIVVGNRVRGDVVFVECGVNNSKQAKWDSK